MPNFKKLYKIIMSGNSDKRISFKELQLFLLQLGFEMRSKGDHFIYTMEGIPEILNIQPDGNKAKPYQVRQIRTIIKKYNLGGETDEQ